jgi:ribonuclease HII
MIDKAEYYRWGADGVGRGNCAGLNIWAVVGVPEGLTLPGVKDSKLTNSDQRAKLVKLIQVSCVVGLGAATPEEIDRLGINPAEGLAVSRAVAHLQSSGYEVRDVIGDLAMPKLCIASRREKAADATHLEVSAASIVAKHALDLYWLIVSAHYPEYGFSMNSGYATVFHKAAIARYGLIEGVHRRSYSPCKEKADSPLQEEKGNFPLTPPPFASEPKPQPKEDAPVVDFWCGGGGVGTAGFFQAGFQIGVNIDRDPKNPKLSDRIADCYELNFGKPVIRETLQEYAARGGFKSQSRPAVVVFTQSCKNLSRANQKGKENSTDIEVAQAAAQGLEELLPSVFVLENVCEYKDSECFKIIGRTLRRNGYRYRYGVLNASSYGVAQDRKRFILIAVAQARFPVFLPDAMQATPFGWGWAMGDLIHTFPLTQPAPWQLKNLNKLEKGKFPFYLVERSGARNTTPQVRGSSCPAWTVKSAIFTDQNNSSRHDGLNTWDGNGEWRRVTNRGVARLMGLYDWYQLPDAPSVFGPLLGNGLPSEMARAIANEVKQVLPRRDLATESLPSNQEGVKAEEDISKSVAYRQLLNLGIPSGQAKYLMQI